MVAIRHSSCPRWNSPPTRPAVLISCVVATARRIFAGGVLPAQYRWVVGVVVVVDRSRLSAMLTAETV
jgi:hypothetical protein